MGARQQRLAQQHLLRNGGSRMTSPSHHNSLAMYHLHLHRHPAHPSVCTVSLPLLCQPLLPSQQDLEEVLWWLSEQPSTYWLAPRPKAKLSNLAAGAITQGSPTLGKFFDAMDADKHPLWQKGLDGRGQVVGVGDSGIDMDSCYFTDPLVPFDNSARRFTSSTHRKVVSYYGLGDPSMKDLAGHGTHVSGSIAGERPGNRYDPATGAAPGAKLAFIDLSADAMGADVSLPDDLAQDYFMVNYQAGARIHSGEAGSDAG